ncbi:hypothetical protein [Sinorhizobium medicae]|uniref:hypothetical protein n=1 Tax=Sinorhizobium medicae TaxID=110321 RepID=UPI000FD82BA1|nr:hypothetical protein [Sinorhizobium medicae]RVJ72538.1 hypothetical protein CN168_26725 [Sinorhizobium medicae]
MAKRTSSPSDKVRSTATAEQGLEGEDIKNTLETKRNAAPPPAPVPADASVSSERDDREIRVGNRKINLKPAKLGKRILDVLPDLPYIRDRVYSPNLRALPGSIFPSIAFPIRDQGLSSSCTGFALAHIIDVLTHRETLATRPVRASARILYEMAKMRDSLELTDTVAAAGLPGYGRSLLYLGSRAYEDQPNTPLAGIEIFSDRLPRSDLLKIDRSESSTTGSTTHGGFDNDPATMTTIMSRIEGRKLLRPPTEDELVGYSPKSAKRANRRDYDGRSNDREYHQCRHGKCICEQFAQ